MSFYKMNFEQFSQEPENLEMLKALERGLAHFNIDFYLIGAVARDVWMRGIHKIAPRRTTRDIDFAVLINDKGVYEQLKDYLIQKEDFQPYSGNSFVLLWKDRGQVDLLPFGAIEDDEGKVTIEGTGYTTIHVDGFKEVYEEGLPEVELEQEHRFKLCSLPGIVLLKLIAWSDRPEARVSDIKDISDILNHFFDMHADEIYERHNDLFDEKTELIEIAAHVMGREIGKILKRNEALFQRIRKLLEVNIAQSSSSPIAMIMTGYFNNTMEENIKLLDRMKQGIFELNN
jgi:predicted nucleotidyltransferase